MLDLKFDYASCVRSSEKVSWKIDEVMPPDTRLDFAKPFLPDALVGSSKIKSLDEAGKLKLNQITGNAYINLFQFVEEYILATAVQHAQAEMFGDHDAIRALVRFADEEGKHQQLFARYRAAFDRDFGAKCGVLGGAADVAGVILSKSAIAVMMTTYHLELMTQAHYTECVRDNTGVDPLFAKLLKFHWMEEAQHARIDALELDKYASQGGPEAIAKGFEEYLGICEAFDGLLAAQAKLDVASLGAALGKELTPAQAAEVEASQHAGYRRTFLVYGMTNKTFVEDLGKLSPGGAAKVAERAKSLS